MGRAGGRGGGGGSRGGSFGGSRGGSFGGGSGRSSSSFSSGRSSSSFGSSSNRSYTNRTSGGYRSTPRMSGPVIINNSGNNRGYKNYDNQNRPVNNTNNSSNNKGCIHIALIAVMVISLLVLLFNCVVVLGTTSEKREPLHNSAVTETEYYTDELNWINNESNLLKGMKHFYKVTGVQPYLYITDDIGGDFYDKAEEFANEKYNELFNDEGHILVLFWEQDYYATYCLSGSAADTVIDAEARDILLDLLDEYYWDSSLDEDEYFSKAFEEAADDIMAAPPSGFVSIAIPLIIFAAALSAEIVIRKKAKDEKRDKELKEMLEKPLETFGNTEAEELAKKYESAKTTSENKADNLQENTPTQVTEIPKPVQSDIFVCPNCSKAEKPENNFCSNCGTKLK